MRNGIRVGISKGCFSSCHVRGFLLHRAVKLYEEVFRKFELVGIRYLVVGGIAVNLHGYACVTVDLDRMLDCHAIISCWWSRH